VTESSWGISGTGLGTKPRPPLPTGGTITGMLHGVPAGDSTPTQRYRDEIFTIIEDLNLAAADFAAAVAAGAVPNSLPGATADGGPGDDRIAGGSHGDLLTGGAGRDRIYGGTETVVSIDTGNGGAAVSCTTDHRSRHPPATHPDDRFPRSGRGDVCRADRHPVGIPGRQAAVRKRPLPPP
jgi:Ca2+-binding RTX toxin-like protein